MDKYLRERSRLFNEASEFCCPDSCERHGCRDSELHITISLVDLIGLSQACGKKVPSLFGDHCKIGFDPLEENEPWVGRLTIELKKPCSFLDEKRCCVYLGRPVACALFPESFFVLGKGDELLKKEIFQKFPCITNPVTVPSRRKEILLRVLQMSAQEIFLSDFYLFGVSPFLVDLKNVAGKVLEGIEVQTEGRAVIPHHRFEAFLVERLQKTELLNHWLSRLRLLDRDEGVNEFWRMKAWTDQIVTMGGQDSFVPIYQFVGNRLQGTRFHPGSR